MRLNLRKTLSKLKNKKQRSFSQFLFRINTINIDEFLLAQCGLDGGIWLLETAKPPTDYT